MKLTLWIWLAPAGLLVTGCSMNLNSQGGGNNADDISGTISIEPGFATRTRTGTTTGTEFVDICDGFSSGQADFTLSVDASTGATLTATADVPIVIHVLCGQSNFCGDLIAPTTSEFGRFWTTGDCDVFILTVNDGDTAEFTLEVSE